MPNAFLQEIILRFLLPGSLQSDNGSEFVSQMTKGLDHKMDLALSLKTPITGESREVQSDLEMGCSQVMSGNSRKLDWASPVAQLEKNLPATLETWVRSLGWEDPLEKGKATHSSILAWRIP